MGTRNISELNLQFPTPDNWTLWQVGPRTEDVLFFENMDVEYWLNFRNTIGWWLFPSITLLYWITSYSLQAYMRDKKPLNLDNFMVTYNTLVGLFSFLALWRLSSTFFPLLLSEDGLYRSICVRFDVTEKDAFWMLAIGWSKLAHFMDTIFGVLKKRPLQFAQMYHHSVVVLVPQYVLTYGEPIIIWWGIINIFQHCLTYPYFALKSMKVKVPSFVSTGIVIVEILQMFAGLGTGVYSLYVLKNNGKCVRHPNSITLMYFVYISMTFLAFYLAYENYQKYHKKSKSE